MRISKDEILQEKYLICCCHVETFAFFLALIPPFTLPMAFLWELIRAAKFDDAPDLIILVSSSANIVCCLFVILAQCKRHSNLYLPYFYIMAVVVLALFLDLHNMIASFDNVLAIEHSSMDSYESNSPADEASTEGQSYLGVVVLICSIWLCFTFIAYYVNWTAWRFLKEENKANNY